MYFADIKSDQTNNLSKIGFKQVFIIGCSQILAIIPGTSRAGIIYTTSRFYRISRVEAAKFSMLLSIPTILISSFIPLIEILNKKDVAFTGDAIAAVLVAFITAMFAIKFLIKWVSSHTMLPFVIYRIVLGSVMLIVAV